MNVSDPLSLYGLQYAFGLCHKDPTISCKWKPSSKEEIRTYLILQTVLHTYISVFQHRNIHYLLSIFTTPLSPSHLLSHPSHLPSHPSYLSFPPLHTFPSFPFTPSPLSSPSPSHLPLPLPHFWLSLANKTCSKAVQRIGNNSG